MLNFYNESVRDNGDFVHHCYRDRSVTVNPIVDWTHRDVWDFLHHYGCEGNPLYQCGQDRIGCIGCPLQGGKGMEADFAKYPKYRANYIRAFDRMLEARREKGKQTGWQSGEEVMRWWVQDDTDPDQLSFFDDEDIYNAMGEE